MRLTTIAAAVIAALVAGGGLTVEDLPGDLPDLPDLPVLPGESAHAEPSRTNRAEQWPSPTRRHVLAQLEGALITSARQDVPGYDRAKFGPEWTDDNTDPAYGHNGCDTRNDVLDDQLRRIHYRPGTSGCVVATGVLRDPYTGQRIRFTIEDATEVQVDHVYPLGRAWDMGAASWAPQRRVEFANDATRTGNLIAADGSANASKSDQGPGEWLPLNRGYACAYVSRYVRVANHYGLALTDADAAAVEEVADEACPRRKS